MFPWRWLCCCAIQLNRGRLRINEVEADKARGGLVLYHHSYIKHHSFEVIPDDIEFACHVLSAFESHAIKCAEADIERSLLNNCFLQMKIVS